MRNYLQLGALLISIAALASCASPGQTAPAGGKSASQSASSVAEPQEPYLVYEGDWQARGAAVSTSGGFKAVASTYLRFDLPAGTDLNLYVTPMGGEKSTLVASKDLVKIDSSFIGVIDPRSKSALARAFDKKGWYTVEAFTGKKEGGDQIARLSIQIADATARNTPPILIEPGYYARGVSVSSSAGLAKVSQTVLRVNGLPNLKWTFRTTLQDRSPIISPVLAPYLLRDSKGMAFVLDARDVASAFYPFPQTGRYRVEIFDGDPAAGRLVCTFDLDYDAEDTADLPLGLMMDDYADSAEITSVHGEHGLYDAAEFRIALARPLALSAFLQEERGNSKALPSHLFLPSPGGYTVRVNLDPFQTYRLSVFDGPYEDGKLIGSLFVDTMHDPDIHARYLKLGTGGARGEVQTFLYSKSKAFADGSPGMSRILGPGSFIEIATDRELSYELAGRRYTLAAGSRVIAGLGEHGLATPDSSPLVFPATEISIPTYGLAMRADATRPIKLHLDFAEQVGPVGQGLAGANYSYAFGTSDLVYTTDGKLLWVRPGAVIRSPAILKLDGADIPVRRFSVGDFGIAEIETAAKSSFAMGRYVFKDLPEGAFILFSARGAVSAVAPGNDAEGAVQDGPFTLRVDEVEYKVGKARWPLFDAAGAVKGSGTGGGS